MKLIMMIAAMTVLSSFALGGSKKVRLDLDRFVAFKGAVRAQNSDLAIQALKSFQNSSAPVTVYLDSPGGSVYHGLKVIHEMEKMRANGTKFVCLVDSMAASMAFQFLIHCDTRYVFRFSAMLWHPVRIGAVQNVTPKLAGELYMSLAYIERTLLDQLLKVLPISKGQFYRHYHAETLHYGFSLDKMMPGFVEVIDGLYNATALYKAVEERKVVPRSIFGFTIQEQIDYIFTKTLEKK